jgi:hypothetical protein
VRVYGNKRAITVLDQAGCRQVGANELFVTLNQKKSRRFCIQQLGGRSGSATVSVLQAMPQGPGATGAETGTTEKPPIQVM